MKKKILRVLREAGDHFVSGQSLCESLGVSRQAVWKNISQLKEAGYEIQSVSNKGYRLIQTPDRLYGPDIESRLSSGCCCKKIECHEQIDSTNTRAKQLAESGEPEGTLVVAEEQTAGKGRRGRRWSSENSVGIWMSLILRPPVKPVQASCITLIAALAVAKGIQNVCQIESYIKWPNDIVVNGKKICGILTEMSSELDYIHYAVVGIGINANTRQFPEEIQDKATSLYLESGKTVDRQGLIAAIMEAFTTCYQKYLQTGDLSLLQEEYNAMLVNRDREVRILYGMEEEADQSQIEQGIAHGIDENGALLVETGQGVKSIVSGEVSVRGIYGYV
ncbi:MAG: biotin--[acetyl-CoA-carboxylase] ligase [Lachnospiraceae bacterium]|nr:biotin--[acetyl-CoA-carboxylase] ligase [Lachnospiraceae bacterium]MBP3458922.1 biotin--[acetyl-CoA-carboxylase] ligase [Lachnospiraceae bacterium]